MYPISPPTDVCLHTALYLVTVVLDHSFQTTGQEAICKAALEYSDPASAQRAFSHMNSGQLDGAILKVELSDLPIRPQRVSRSPLPPRARNGRGGGRGGRGDTFSVA